jgi:hypothetical protein
LGTFQQHRRQAFFVFGLQGRRPARGGLGTNPRVPVIAVSRLPAPNTTPVYTDPTRDLDRRVPMRKQCQRTPSSLGSNAGAVAHEDGSCLYPEFPPSCPSRVNRSPVSSARHVARSVPISGTTRSCTVHEKGYETYHAGAAVGEDRK